MSAPPEGALAVRNLWHGYGPKRVLENINLDIAPGSFCSIIGASGCGKSTFLRLLLSQERPEQGRITLDGAPLPAEPGPDRGVVFQRFTVLPHLTVLANTMLGPAFAEAPWSGVLFGSKRMQAREKALALLERVGLVHVRDAYPKELSGGMQ